VYELYNLFYYEDYCVRQIREEFEKYDEDKDTSHLGNIHYYLKELKIVHEGMERRIFDIDELVGSLKRK